MNDVIPIPTDPTAPPVCPTTRMIGIDEVVARTGLSRATIYGKMRKKEKNRQYDPSFPRQIALSDRRVAWIEHEIEEWLQKRALINRGSSFSR